MLINRIRSPSLRLKLYLPALSETAVHKRHASSQDFHHKRGPGGRSSFNGVVATVFGSTGFLGRYTVSRLGRCGTQVIVPFRCDEHDIRHMRLMGDLGQIMFQDFHLKDSESIAKVMAQSNVVINLVGKDHATRNFSFEECNVDGARAIAKAAKQVGVKRFIHVSALNADVDSESEFLSAKARGELAVRAEFPEATILRPAPFYGPEDDYFNRYAYMRNHYFGVPLLDMGMSTIKRPVYVVDVARAILNATLSESAAGKTYELYGPEEYYLYDIVEYIFKVIGRDYNPYNMSLNGPTHKFFKYIAELRNASDTLYREFLSDEINEDLPGFADLGLQPSSVNDQTLKLLKWHRGSYHYEDLDDDNLVCNPRPITKGIESGPAQLYF